MKTNKILTGLAALAIAATTFTMAVGAVQPSYTVSDVYQGTLYYDNLLSIELSGDGATDVIAVALSQLGYHEGNSERDFAGGNPSGSRNFVEYNRYHGKLDNNEGNGYSYGYYWCASFSTWCAVQAGIPGSIVPTADGVGVSTQRLRSWFLNNAKYPSRVPLRFMSFNTRFSECCKGISIYLTRRGLLASSSISSSSTSSLPSFITA